MSATLTEQMGAMAIVDDLRHRQRLIQEHLDLPARRQEVINKIRAYYQSKGIEADNALIEQGTREYFERRLTFEAPEIGYLSSCLATFYITRDKWWKTAALGVATSVLIGIGGVQIAAHMDANKTQSVQQVVDRANSQLAGLKNTLHRLNTQRDVLRERVTKADLPAGLRMLTRTDEITGQGLLVLERELAIQVTANTRDAASKSVETANTDLDAVSLQFQQFDRLLQEVASLLDAQTSLRNLTGQTAYQTLRKGFPAVQTIEEAAVSAIATADANQNGVVNATKAVHRLSSTAGDVARILNFKKLEAETLGRFLDMKLTDPEKSQIAAIHSSFKAATERLDAKAAESSLQELNTLRHFAETPLTLNVVDRTGVKSGVERNYAKSGGKSWYLVVEATDPSGKVVPVMVKNVETGEKRLTQLFAVRVTQQEYESTKADKRDDGHVDNRFVGEKPVNSLSIRYASRIVSNPDMITEW